MNPRPGLFILSLDLELGWGYRDVRLDRSVQRRVHRARESAPQLLDLLQSFEIRATWAAVGALGLASADQLFAFDEVPTVRALERGGRGGLSEQVTRLPELYFFPEFVERLRALEDQELGGHTLTHLTCGRATVEACDALAAELRACQALAAKRGAELSSLVFPGNYYSSPFLQIARRAGFRCYRGDRFVSASAPRSRLRQCWGRGARLASAYLGSSGRGGAISEAGLLNIPGDRFLRLEDGAFLGRAHLARVRGELERVAASGGTYHLWLHPHNLAGPGNFAFEQLGAVLETVAALRARGALRSVTMAEAAGLFS